MKTKFIIGADISKSKINFCLFIDSKNHMEREVENDKDSLKKFIKEVSSSRKALKNQINAVLIWFLLASLQGFIITF